MRSKYPTTGKISSPVYRKKVSPAIPFTGVRAVEEVQLDLFEDTEVIGNFPGVSDVDSFMVQSVGQNSIGLWHIESCVTVVIEIVNYIECYL